MGRKGDQTIKFRIRHPHRINIYTNGKNPSLYFYFRWNRKSYRGSTGTTDLDSSIDKSIHIFYKISEGKQKEIREKVYKFEGVVKEYLRHKKEMGLTDRTLSDYRIRFKFLQEYFKGSDITTLCSDDVYQKYLRWRKDYYKIHEERRIQTYKKDG